MPDPLKSLCDAASAGDLDIVRKVLSENRDLLFQKHEGATALHFAALHGQNSVVDYLVQAGADRNITDDEFGSPPAGWANEKGQESTIGLLESHGIHMSPCQAAAWGRLARLEQLVRADPRAVEDRDAFGTPLHEAVVWGRTRIVRFLLDHGADPDAVTRDGGTALDLAEAQAKNARNHASIVVDSRRAEIERECVRITEILKAALI